MLKRVPMLFSSGIHIHAVVCFQIVPMLFILLPMKLLNFEVFLMALFCSLMGLKG